MKGIEVKALSEVGQAAIENIMTADNGRNDWKLYFKETIIADRPYRIRVEFKHRAYTGVFTVKQLVEVVNKQLTIVGAVEGVDYEVIEL